MSGRYILGLDEGTTGVKAALFDEELKPAGEARRDKVNTHPRSGWVEQDGNEVLAVVVEAIGELLADPPGEIVACGIDHQGESVLAWDAETRRAAEPDRRLAGQALAGDPRRAGRPRGRGQGGERPAVRSVLLRGEVGLAAEARQGRPEGGRRGSPADGHRRLVPVRPPRRRLRHRPLHRVTHSAPADRQGRLGRGALPAVRRPDGRPPRDPRHDRRPGRAEPPRLAHRPAPVRADGRPAGGAGRRRRRRAGPGQGHLRHRGLRAGPRRHRRAEAGGWPAAHDRLADRRPHGVRPRRRRVRRRGDARVALQGAKAWPRHRRSWASWPARPTLRATPGCCPAWPGSARRGGGRTPRR